ncbi:hypothetical protein [Aquimarina sp. 2201CG5-10]|uniref:hypothetical protein n=1 Tax=Aquimarina callyspongiae TaxID=3098150 RepID=UPI002AB541C2|nr:hypothetical protein [Aquimarina sp. 2201CG5-10]MDY8137944.1 hypothetical protein [Aquimarina sp. 2201CG5-10]
MKTYKYKILIIIVLGITWIQAQSIERQVIGTAGTTVSNGTISMDFTVGELTITTITDGTTTLSQGFQQGSVQLNIKIAPVVFLQGAAINPNAGEETLMRDDLRVANTIPTTSPYNDALTTASTVLIVTGKDAIVDWVLVELRDKNDVTNVVASQSALLQRDGDIISVDGISTLEFDISTDNYFVAVQHRNHLGIVSANTVDLSSTVTTLDFSSDNLIVQGGNNAVVDLGSGVFAMLGGDFDENGQIQNSDIISVIQVLGGSGYSMADMDMNGQIQNTDINNIMNLNLGKGEQF